MKVARVKGRHRAQYHWLWAEGAKAAILFIIVCAIGLALLLAGS